ncbi:MAG: hypothetical protein QW520_01385 [Methanomassiliicoccales archaeon]
MEEGYWLRRIVHMSAPLLLIYYAIPDFIFGVGKWLGLVLILIIVLFFDLMRLAFQWRIIGFRDYEYRRLSAAAWAALGFTLIFLLFPLEIAAPAVLGMALVDPMIGELRRRESRLYPLLPAIFYYVLASLCFYYIIGFDWIIMLACLIATILAIGVERARTKFVDDDFLMLVVPACALAITLSLTSSLS